MKLMTSQSLPSISVSYLPQPGIAKIKMFSHDFEVFHLKKQNVEVNKGIGLCCPDLYSF